MGKIPRYVKYLRHDIAYAGRNFLLNVVAGAGCTPRGLRILLYRAGGVSVGRSNIYPHARFTGPAPVTIASNTMINTGATFDNWAPIEIREGVAVGPEVYFGTTSHELGDAKNRAGAVVNKPITILAGCWIGARSVILPGVTIGEGVIVAAGAVVTSDCEPHTLYGGVPARAIRKLDVASTPESLAHSTQSQ